MEIMKNLAAEGKKYSFLSHISLVRSCRWQTDAVYLEKENYIGTVDIKDTTPENAFCNDGGS